MPDAQVGHFRNEAARARFVAAYRKAFAELPRPHRTFDVPTSFGTARVYRFHGPAGVPVVLLPGRNESTPMWGPNIPGLVERRTVFSVDLVGEPGMSVQRRGIADAADRRNGWSRCCKGLLWSARI